MTGTLSLYYKGEFIVSKRYHTGKRKVQFLALWSKLYGKRLAKCTIKDIEDEKTVKEKC